MYRIDSVNYHHSVFTGSQVFHSHFFHRLLIVGKEYYWKVITYNTYTLIYEAKEVYMKEVYIERAQRGIYGSVQKKVRE